MGKIIVPQANEKEKEAFKHGGITLIESISEKEIVNEKNEIAGPAMYYLGNTYVKIEKDVLAEE